MKLNRRGRERADVPTASLNDILFFLLLFFLIISTMASHQVLKVLLPKSEASESVSKKFVTLTITESKQYKLDDRNVDFRNLEQTLIETTKAMQEPTVLVNIPATLSVQDLVDVVQIGTKHKIKMVLGTQKIN
jgi:biopolymer transport protein ExbD